MVDATITMGEEKIEKITVNREWFKMYNRSLARLIS